MGKRKQKRNRKPACLYIAPGLRDLAVRMDDLSTDPDNARAHGQADLEAIRDSLAAFGQQKPIVIGTGGRIIAGNGVFLAARMLGWTMIAACESNLTGRLLRAFAIGDNWLAGRSTWEQERLGVQVTDIMREGADLLSAMGLQESDLADLMGQDDGANVEGRIEDISIPEPPRVVWILLAVPLDDYAAAREAIMTLEAIATITVEVSR